MQGGHKKTKMLRRNGLVIRPWSQSIGPVRESVVERSVKEVGLEPRVKERERFMDGESVELTGS